MRWVSELSFGQFFLGSLVVIGVLVFLPVFGKSPAEIEAYGKKVQELGKTITSLFFALLFLFLIYIVGSALWGS